MQWTWEHFTGQGAAIQSLHSQLIQDRFPHALLITGDRGVGKRTLAAFLSAALLCRSDGERPCRKCGDCLRTEKDEHPNLITLAAGTDLATGRENGRKTISVEDVRETVRRCGAWTLDGGRRVVRILEAGDLTPQAQNALLKTLEEPPEGVFFLLTSSQPAGLLATIVSRCRPLRIHPWDEKTIEGVLRGRGVPSERMQTALRLSHGSIGEAIRLGEDESFWLRYQEIQSEWMNLKKRSDILAISTAWKDRKNEAELLFTCLEEQLRGLMTMRLEPENAENRALVLWENFVKKAPLERFTFLLDQVAEVRKRVQANGNFQALLEQLLFCLIGEREKWRE